MDRPNTLTHVLSCLAILAVWGLCPSTTLAAKPSREETPAQRGYRFLTTKPYLPPDFDQEVFDNLWKVWPAELREKAKEATSAERRRMAFSRYGLMERPESDGTGPALGYVDDGKGGWVMNCLACHTGKVAGKVILGVPNSHYGLQTLTDEVRTVKLQQLKPLGHMELGALKIPLGATHGTTNSVMFGVALGRHRDKDLNFQANLYSPEFIHHDMDAPPFWNVKRKKYLYCDGFVEKSPRPLLQFVMLPRNSGETLKSWEPEYRDLLAWIESLESPRYPHEIDEKLAARGKTAFNRTCARCHGTYGNDSPFPEKVIPIDEIQTDPLRLRSLTTDYRQHMQDGWIGEYGKRTYRTNPGGYVAPPLNGVWATAPYLHNGSVPTLWHFFHPEARPVVWQRTEDGYDTARVGLEITPFDSLPPTAKTAADRRVFFDTRLPGKSAAGHPFVNELDEDEKQAVLEYLKTL